MIDKLFDTALSAIDKTADVIDKNIGTVTAVKGLFDDSGSSNTEKVEKVIYTNGTTSEQAKQTAESNKMPAWGWGLIGAVVAGLFVMLLAKK